MLGNKLTFKGGIHIPEFKELSSHMAIENTEYPDEVIIPLIQHVGPPCEALVKVGDEVKVGQMIGWQEISLSAPVHSSVSGKVKKIEERFTQDGSKCQCVIISNDFQETLGYELLNRDFEKMSIDDIIKEVRMAGVVGMGGAAFPAHSKLDGARSGIDSVIINAAECEPFLTCDHRMMLEWGEKLVTGLKIIMKVTNATNGYIGIEDNKPDAIENMTKLLAQYTNLNVAVLKTKFPQGDSYRMVDSILKRKVPKGGRTGNVHTLVTNVGTAIAIYEAVVFGKPSYERVVTVTGDGVKQPRNILARVGTPIKHLIKSAGGFSGNPEAVIAGGPMTGFSQFDLDVPVQKNSSGILVLKEDPATKYNMSPCIRCAKCLNACPVHLLPLNIAELMAKGRLEDTQKYNAQACIACGSCSYICPAHRPLTELISAAKRELKLLSKKSR